MLETLTGLRFIKLVVRSTIVNNENARKQSFLQMVISRPDPNARLNTLEFCKRSKGMDKQLAKIHPDAVQLKIKRGQGLSAKEFSVATSFSYTVVRAMFKDLSFPAFRRKGVVSLVFWPDWEQYRRREVGLSSDIELSTDGSNSPQLKIQAPASLRGGTPAQRARVNSILAQVI